MEKREHCSVYFAKFSGLSSEHTKIFITLENLQYHDACSSSLLVVFVLVVAKRDKIRGQDMKLPVRGVA